jgi:uncharacterized protein (UPF0303 family)/catechol 2,3-dioxygenase-like lactoylglutathione lyase family enzyme
MVDPSPWSLADLLDQEERTTLERFSDTDALELGAILLARASLDRLRIAIDVSRGRHQLFHAALPGTSAEEDSWLRRKTRTVAHFGHSSQYVTQAHADEGTDLERDDGLSAAKFALSGGGVPIRARNAGVVGILAISGLTGIEDHELAIWGLEQLSTAPPGIPTARNVDHVAYTVPDLDAAVDFFVEHLGAELIFRDGPFGSPGDAYMLRKLNVHPEASCKLAMLRMGRHVNLELFEYDAPERILAPPRNSDIGGGHLALYVDDIDAAYAYLAKVPGVTLMDGPNDVAESSPVAGQRWFYFLTPWGLHMELTTDSTGTFYSGLPGARMAPPHRWV